MVKAVTEAAKDAWDWLVDKIKAGLKFLWELSAQRQVRGKDGERCGGKTLFVVHTDTNRRSMHWKMAGIVNSPDRTRITRTLRPRHPRRSPCELMV